MSCADSAVPKFTRILPFANTNLFRLGEASRVKLCIGLLLSASLGLAADSTDLAKVLGVSFPTGKDPVIEIQRAGKTYLIDAASHTVREKDDNSGSQLFASNCASCHGPDGKGKPEIGSRDLTNSAFQRSISDEHLASVVREGAAG